MIRWVLSLLRLLMTAMGSPPAAYDDETPR
jgi:hypothetical protein